MNGCWRSSLPDCDPRAALMTLPTPLPALSPVRPGTASGNRPLQPRHSRSWQGLNMSIFAKKKQRTAQHARAQRHSAPRPAGTSSIMGQTAREVGSGEGRRQAAGPGPRLADRRRQGNGPGKGSRHSGNRVASSHEALAGSSRFPGARPFAAPPVGVSPMLTGPASCAPFPCAVNGSPACSANPD